MLFAYFSCPSALWVSQCILGICFWVQILKLSELCTHLHLGHMLLSPVPGLAFRCRAYRESSSGLGISHAQSDLLNLQSHNSTVLRVPGSVEAFSSQIPSPQILSAFPCILNSAFRIFRVHKICLCLSFPHQPSQTCSQDARKAHCAHTNSTLLVKIYRRLQFLQFLL